MTVVPRLSDRKFTRPHTQDAANNWACSGLHPGQPHLDEDAAAAQAAEEARSDGGDGAGDAVAGGHVRVDGGAQACEHVRRVRLRTTTEARRRGVFRASNRSHRARSLLLLAGRGAQGGGRARASRRSMSSREEFRSQPVKRAPACSCSASATALMTTTRSTACGSAQLTTNLALRETGWRQELICWHQPYEPAAGVKSCSEKKSGSADLFALQRYSRRCDIHSASSVTAAQRRQGL